MEKLQGMLNLPISFECIVADGNFEVDGDVRICMDYIARGYSVRVISINEKNWRLYGPEDHVEFMHEIVVYDGEEFLVTGYDNMYVYCNNGMYMDYLDASLRLKFASSGRKFVKLIEEEDE